MDTSVQAVNQSLIPASDNYFLSQIAVIDERAMNICKAPMDDLYFVSWNRALNRKTGAWFLINDILRDARKNRDDSRRAANTQWASVPFSMQAACSNGGLVTAAFTDGNKGVTITLYNGINRLGVPNIVKSINVIKKMKPLMTADAICAGNMLFVKFTQTTGGVQSRTTTVIINMQTYKRIASVDDTIVMTNSPAEGMCIVACPGCLNVYCANSAMLLASAAVDYDIYQNECEIAAIDDLIFVNIYTKAPNHLDSRKFVKCIAFEFGMANDDAQTGRWPIFKSCAADGCVKKRNANVVPSCGCNVYCDTCAAKLVDNDCSHCGYHVTSIVKATCSSADERACVFAQTVQPLLHSAPCQARSIQ